MTAVEYVPTLEKTSECPGLPINFPYICSASNVISSSLITEYKCGPFPKLPKLLALDILGIFVCNNFPLKFK
jgi:hypothetical protein